MLLIRPWMKRTQNQRWKYCVIAMCFMFLLYWKCLYFFLFLSDYYFQKYWGLSSSVEDMLWDTDYFVFFFFFQSPGKGLCSSCANLSSNHVMFILDHCGHFLGQPAVVLCLLCCCWVLAQGNCGCICGAVWVFEFLCPLLFVSCSAF